MSNLRPKPAAEINLEEFERRLRAAAAPQASVEDPLAELTRLVDTIGFERTPSERALEATRTPAPRPALKPPAALAAPAEAKPPEPKLPEPKLPEPKVAELRPAPRAVPAPPALKMTPPAEDSFDPEASFAAEAAPPLRPSFDEHEEADAFAPPPLSRAEDVEPVVLAPSAPPPAARPRDRHWGLKVGGLVAASIVMIGAVAVFKVGRASHSGAPPLILAATAPTKVAPPSEETVRTANETGNLLTRDTAQTSSTPPKLVAPPEAPVDLAARPQPTASPTPTADVSPVAPASETPIVSAPAAHATPAAPVSGDPSRVKTISVRPDGTLISSGFESSAPTPAPTPTPAATPTPAPTTLADGEAATPAAELPTKLSPPKNATRVVPKSDTTAPADSGAGPVPVKPHKPKPTPTPTVAEAEPKTDDAAPADAGAAAAASKGGYAVQLAAPRSQADANALIKSLPNRYAEALGGATLGVRKADRNGETIYRVRAMGLTRAEANAMCAKVKAAGGDCYPTKN